MPDAQTIHLTPTGTAFIAGVPAVECDVTPKRAAELLAYYPPAFTAGPPVKPPVAPVAPEPDAPAKEA